MFDCADDPGDLLGYGGGACDPCYPGYPGPGICGPGGAGMPVPLPTDPRPYNPGPFPPGLPGLPGTPSYPFPDPGGGLPPIAMTLPPGQMPYGYGYGGGMSPQGWACMQAGQRVIKSVQRNRRYRREVYAGLVPVIPLAVRDDSVAAGATETISIDVVVPYRIVDFKVAPSIAALFWILDIKVARMSMMADHGAPAELFTPDSRHAAFENPILAAGVPPQVSVENLDDDAPHPFYAAFLGTDETPPFARLF